MCRLTVSFLITLNHHKICFIFTEFVCASLASTTATSYPSDDTNSGHFVYVQTVQSDAVNVKNDIFANPDQSDNRCLSPMDKAQDDGFDGAFVDPSDSECNE